MYDKSFEDISSGKMELFSSFFSAIKTFISEMLLDGSKELRNIGIGDYTVLVTSIPELKADLVMIADQDDIKILNKLIPKILKVLMKHQQVFLEWDGNRNEFSILDQPLSELILSKRKLVEGTTLLENPQEFLKGMWEHKGDLSDQLVNNLDQERTFLLGRYSKTTNLLRKLAIAEKVLELSEKLRDEETFLKFQKEVKLIRDQIKDTKIKLKYYLDKAKNSLSDSVDHLGNKPIHEGDYKDAYINLYSFSTKLKAIVPGIEWQEYRNLAQILINKDETSDHELSEAIQKILNINDDIESFFLDKA
ncbi:MAG: hypothetical protein ACTSR8_06050 [Promethearchaeota archaeon]